MRLTDKEHSLLIAALNYATDQLSIKEITKLRTASNQATLLELKERYLKMRVSK